MDGTKSRLEDEVKENKEKQESPFCNKIPIISKNRIPIIDKFFGKKESSPLSSESSPVVSNKEEIDSVTTDENREHVINGQANVEGDIGQSNPEAG